MFERSFNLIFASKFLNGMLLSHVSFFNVIFVIFGISICCEWAQQQEDEYCWMGVGQFIPPPNPHFHGKFIVSNEDSKALNLFPLNSTMDFMMKTYFQRYPQLIYAGSRFIQNKITFEGDAIQFEFALTNWRIHHFASFFWVNIVSLLAIRLGNATGFYEDWKSNSHCPNIFWASEHNWGSPWKGKVFKCNK